MIVSVIITTKDEEKNIENCLRSIKVQNYPQEKIEIIVVDNGSTDRTKTLCYGVADKVLDRGPERSAQRNFGVENATGECILYLDADMTLTKNVLADCTRRLSIRPDVGALYISEKIAGKSFWNRVRNFERSFYDGTVIDAVRFIRKDVFLKSGGFDEKLTGPEDWDLDKRIRSITKTDLIRSTIFHHEEDFSLIKYLGKKKYYSRSFEAYISKWGRNDSDIKKQLGFWYRLFGVFFEDGKWKRIMRHPVLTAGVYFLRFLVGFNFLFKK
jgi:glycosyltransferase involved in cell wall biosynthesis